MNKDHKITVVIPVLPGNGAKWITSQLALQTKRNFPLKEVALADMDLKTPSLAENLTNDTVHSIDNLLEKIDGDILTQDIFAENMVLIQENIHLLCGIQFFHDPGYLKQKHIQTIFDYLRTIYQETFVVVHPDFDNAGTIYSCFNADRIILIVKNNPANLKYLPKKMENINLYKRTSQPINVIYNYYLANTQNPANTQADFGTTIRNLHLEVLGMIPYQESFGYSTETSKKERGFFKGKNKGLSYFNDILLHLRKGGAN